MKQSHYPVIIVGAGMSGLLAALFIKKRRPSSQITIVEHSGEAGGHYREVDLAGFGWCDRAMRLIYETGIPELDQVIRDILPDNEWQEFPGNEKDIAGIYWQGGLQCHSPYIDLRRLPQSVTRQCEKEILQHLHSSTESIMDAGSYLLNRFGPTAAEYLVRVLEKFYAVPATKLDVSATFQPAMNRVVLYDEERMQALLQDEALCKRIAWPDQLTLPIQRSLSQSALYPKKFGMNRVIDAMVRQLLDQGVRFLFNRRITSCEIAAGSIASVTLDDDSRLDASQVIAANGMHSAHGLLYGKQSYPAAPPCWLVFLRITLPPRMERLYHFYCFDEACATFRVTHYYNYCPDAHDGTGYPLCIELWQDAESETTAIAQALRELQLMDILAPGTAVVAQAALRSSNMHALCTLEFMQNTRRMRTELEQQIPANMIAVGPFVEDGVMLLYEVWRDMYQKLITIF